MKVILLFFQTQVRMQVPLFFMSFMEMGEVLA